MKTNKRIVMTTAVVFVAVIQAFAYNNERLSETEFSTKVKMKEKLDRVFMNRDLHALDDTSNMIYTKAYVDFNYFEEIAAQAKEHRKTRLIDFKTFVDYSNEQNTIILDTRSKRMYDKMHIKAAVHINFADFTQRYLAEMIPDQNTRILIYCNNNFYQEPQFIIPFETKSVVPDFSEIEGLGNLPQISPTLALNIPTYINLYGYNYRNVYELSELVSSKHPNLELEGTDVVPFLLE